MFVKPHIADVSYEFFSPSLQRENPLVVMSSLHGLLYLCQKTVILNNQIGHAFTFKCG
jgi:hypothetical protein